MRTTSLTLLMSVAAALASPASAQDIGPLDFHRADWAVDVPAAIGVATERDGVRAGVIAAWGDVDKPLENGGVYRGTVIGIEVKCAGRLWRITDVTWFDRDYRKVAERGEATWAPLVRQTPLHASVSDVCDGGLSGPADFTADRPEQILRWLDGV